MQDAFSLLAYLNVSFFISKPAELNDWHSVLIISQYPKGCLHDPKSLINPNYCVRTQSPGEVTYHVDHGQCDSLKYTTEQHHIIVEFHCIHLYKLMQQGGGQRPICSVPKRERVSEDSTL